jgi:nitrate/TMAO reductase-like tetraheme cytochrome c subunit
MTRGNKKGTLGRLLWAGTAFSVFALCIMVLAWPGKHDQQTAQEATANTLAWGAESLKDLPDTLQKISPIALANACGLGASSCFKCHNGKRAPAVDYDPNKAPWHAQHREVNFSCNGCHRGNPRIMMKDLSHKGMIKAPLSGETCASCHKSDLAKAEAAYKPFSGGGK